MKIWIDLAGWLGAALFLISYGLLVSKRWRSDQARFHLANFLGALLICLNTWYDSSFPSVFINGVWGMIALYGLKKDRSKVKAG